MTGKWKAVWLSNMGGLAPVLVWEVKEQKDLKERGRYTWLATVNRAPRVMGLWQTPSTTTERAKWLQCHIPTPPDAGEDGTAQPLWRRVWQCLTELNVNLPYGTASHCWLFTPRDGGLWSPQSQDTNIASSPTHFGPKLETTPMPFGGGMMKQAPVQPQWTRRRAGTDYSDTQIWVDF